MMPLTGAGSQRPRGRRMLICSGLGRIRIKVNSDLPFFSVLSPFLPTVSL
jgi:hypothetical protein